MPCLLSPGKQERDPIVSEDKYSAYHHTSKTARMQEQREKKRYF